MAILREEGSNGDREMAAAFAAVGFEVVDLTTRDLINNPPSFLDQFRGLAIVGGFSYADVLGAGRAWYFHLVEGGGAQALQRFYQRSDTFSFGVCNGCQLMSYLGWIKTPFKMETNTSTRFESRFSLIRINPSPAIMLKNMENSILGCWVAHKEGRFQVLPTLNQNQISIQYVKPNRETATSDDYPYNPNGSVLGLAGLTSEDGRHLAMMPHPERCFQYWQWPTGQPKKHGYSPWIQMFKNAYNWVNDN